MKGLAALALLLPSAAGAWEAHRTADGHYLRWSFPGGQPMVVRLIDPPPGLRLKLGSDLRTALLRAAETWQAVASAHVPVRLLPQIRPRAPQRGEVVISFDAATDFPAGRDAAGLTDLFVTGRDITAAHVHLNARDFDWATDGSDSALDVQSVAAHELGHALGLAHPCGDLDTNTPSCTALPSVLFTQLQADVMFPSIKPGPHRTLSQDDRDGLIALHPAKTVEIAPALLGVQPACLESRTRVGPGLGQQLVLTVDLAPYAERRVAPDLDSLELSSSGVHVASAGVQRDASGLLYALVGPDVAPPPAQLDALLVASSGKAGALLNAISIRDACKPSGGCASGGASLWALAPLALFGLRRRRGLLVAVLLFCALPAHAYLRTKNTGGLWIWWNARGHSFMIDARGTPDTSTLAAFTAIRKSFASWSAVSCSDLSFPDLGISQDPKDRVVGYSPGQYNRNLVLFRTTNCHTGVVPPGDSCLTQGGCGNKYDCWDHGDGVIATTTTTSNRFTGQITDSDIEMNDAPAPDGVKFVFTAVDGQPCADPNQTGCVRMDIQNTVTHEAGHTLGLDHSTDPTATMYATAPEGEVSKRQIHTDDQKGICAIYPKGERTVTSLNDPITLTAVGSSNGGGCGCSQNQTGPGAALGALLLLLQMRRRSRRKPQLAMSANSTAASASLRPRGRVS